MAACAVTYLRQSSPWTRNFRSISNPIAPLLIAMSSVARAPGGMSRGTRRPDVASLTRGFVQKAGFTLTARVGKADERLCCQGGWVHRIEIKGLPVVTNFCAITR